MFAGPEVFTCIKRYHIAHQNARNAGTFSPGLFLHAIMAEDSAFLPGAAPEGSLPGGDPSFTLPLIFTLQTPQEPLQLQSKQCRKAVRFHPPRATVPTAPGLRKTLLSGGFLHEKDHASYRSPCLGAGSRLAGSVRLRARRQRLCGQRLFRLAAADLREGQRRLF